MVMDGRLVVGGLVGVGRPVVGGGVGVAVGAVVRDVGFAVFVEVGPPVRVDPPDWPGDGDLTGDPLLPDVPVDTDAGGFAGGVPCDLGYVIATSTAIAPAAMAIVAAITAARLPERERGRPAPVPGGVVKSSGAISGLVGKAGDPPATAALPAANREPAGVAPRECIAVSIAALAAPGLAAVAARRAAAAIVAAEGKRCDGCFAIPVITTSRTAGGTSAGRSAGLPWTCANATATALSPVNGGTPARQWYATAASEYTSVAGVIWCFIACSGAM